MATRMLLSASILLGFMSWAVTAQGGCGSTDKGCLGACDGTSCYAITWIDNVDHVEFSINADYPEGSGANAYMAIGLSDDEKMGRDGVTECVFFNDVMSVYNSENVADGKDNKRLPTKHASLLHGSYVKGQFNCTFHLPKQGLPDMFNVTRSRYILFARSTNVQAGQIGKHIPFPVVSTVLIDFQSKKQVTAEAKTLTLVKIHGSLMVIAWIFAASIGIIIARYFKPQWPENTCLGQKVWFQFHRGFMMLVFLAGSTAFVLIFVSVKGYSELGEEISKRAHPIVGIIATFLMVINPIMAIFRPHPGDANRPLFNWAHFGVGQSAHILGVVAIFLGINLGYLKTPDWIIWLLVGYVVWQILMELMLVFIRCQADNKDRSELYELSQKGTAPRNAKASDNQSSPTRQGFLLLHIIVVTGIATTVVVLILIS